MTQRNEGKNAKGDLTSRTPIREVPQFQALYGYWSSFPRIDGVPQIAKLDPLKFRAALGDVMLVEPLEDGNDFRYVLYGSNIAQRLGRDMTGLRAAEIDTAPCISHFFIRSYQAAVANRRAYLTFHVPPKNVAVSTWRRLILPICRLDHAVDLLLVCNIPGEWRPVIDKAPYALACDYSTSGAKVETLLGAKCVSAVISAEGKTNSHRPAQRAAATSELDQMIGARLKFYRLAWGYSQTMLAQKLGIACQQIQQFEDGTNRITVSRLIDFSRILEFTMSEFFDGICEEVSKVTNFPNKIIDELSSPQAVELNKRFAEVKSFHMRRAVSQLIKDIGVTHNSE